MEYTVKIGANERRRIAIEWLMEQKERPDGYKTVLDLFLRSAHMAPWSWADALRYAAKLCSKEYSVPGVRVIGAGN